VLAAHIVSVVSSGGCMAEAFLKLLNDGLASNAQVRVALWDHGIGEWYESSSYWEVLGGPSVTFDVELRW